MKSQFSEVFMVFVVKYHDEPVPGWTVAENKRGVVYAYYKADPVGIAIRDLNTPHIYLYSTIKNGEDDYTLIVDLADTSVNVTEQRTLNVGAN